MMIVSSNNKVWKFSFSSGGDRIWEIENEIGGGFGG